MNERFIKIHIPGINSFCFVCGIIERKKIPGGEPEIG